MLIFVRKLFSFLFCSLVSLSVSFALNVEEVSSKKFESKEYSLFFKVAPSTHETKNTLSVGFECKNKKKSPVTKILKEIEVCNINYKTVSIEKASKGYLLKFSPLMRVDWDEYNRKGSKGKKNIKPQCIRSSKEDHLIQIDFCD